ncbi:MAG TPA: 4-(cytidine 5'-diphospho)-2-C-methyl-D-erythritol kinase [Mycobacteriales bacterium]|nr:4-(cytidine 5'-diphospho)-2-C-methyl-D-erythritol kinase [Mycobacteriales bacterium]
MSDAGAYRVEARAPAKVNLHLGVGARRPDGFHELITVYQAVSLFDEVALEPASRLSCRVDGEGAAAVPRGNDNLAVRAVRAVAALAGALPKVRITVRKTIPVAAGLAGGSADAAAALVAADAFFGAGLSRSTLLQLASGLGSDVPFCLLGGTAVGTGRGEVVSPALSRGEYRWVLALAEQGLSTPVAYAELDRLRAGGHPDAVGPPDAVLAAVRAADVVGLGRGLGSDLQAAAVSLRPGLRRVLDAGRELGAVGGVVSGSGPTVALLARDNVEATRIAAVLAGMGVCRTVRRAHGPVPGARLIDESALRARDGQLR